MAPFFENLVGGLTPHPSRLYNCLPLTFPPLTRFSPGLLFYKKYFIKLFFLWLHYCKKQRIFKIKQISLFYLYCWLVLILLFCVYVFLRVLFHSFAIMKLWIALHLLIFIASYLTSHQIMWHKKGINGHGLKVTQAVVIFSASEETKFDVDTTSIILSYLCHFGNVNKELFRYS